MLGLTIVSVIQGMLIILLGIYLLKFRRSQADIADMLADVYKDVYILKLAAQTKGRIAYVSSSGTSFREILGESETHSSEEDDEDGGGSNRGGPGSSGSVH